MKKKLFALLMFFLVLLLFGCRNQGNEPVPSSSMQKSKEELKIVTSFYPMYIMALNITRDVPGVQVVNLTKPVTGCLHDYQLTPENMKCLQDAEMMIVNGAGMEAFLEKVIKQYPDLKIIEACKGLQMIKNQSDGEPNPHLWVSVSGAMEQVKNIEKQITVLDPVNAKAYQKNSAAYLKKLEILQNDMHKVLDHVQNRNIVTFHEAFPYFAREFNLNIAAVVEREPGSEPSAGELAKTVKTIKEMGIKVIFAEPQYSVKAAETIARETEAKVYYLDPAVTGSADPDGYIKIMQKNLKVLQEALL